jgi:hypothetical protein
MGTLTRETTDCEKQETLDSGGLPMSPAGTAGATTPDYATPVVAADVPIGAAVTRRKKTTKGH